MPTLVTFFHHRALNYTTKCFPLGQTFNFLVVCRIVGLSAILQYVAVFIFGRTQVRIPSRKSASFKNGLKLFINCCRQIARKCLQLYLDHFCCNSLPVNVLPSIVLGPLLFQLTACKCLAIRRHKAHLKTFR